MIFKDNSELYATEVERKQGEDILYVNFLGAPFIPSLADNPDIMARTIEFLAENPGVSRIVFVQQRNYHYPYEQVKLLREISGIYNYLIKQENILSLSTLSFFGNAQIVYSEFSDFLNLLKQHPLAAYFKIKQKSMQLKSNVSRNVSIPGEGNYLVFLEKLLRMFEQTKIIKEHIDDFSDSISREIYADIFRADILPNFTFTRLVAQIDTDAQLVDQYEINAEHEKIQVSILKQTNEAKYIYHVMPPEYSLSEEQHMILYLARNVILEHRPKAEEFTDPEKTRGVFFNISRDLVFELARSKGINLTHKEVSMLSKILVRHTIGFGLIEVLLMDNNLQDVVLNAPIALNPVFVRHGKYGDCVTNVIPSYDDADSWAAKLRLQSGRPLDEANPVLDSDLVFGNVRARIAAVKEPLSPSGLSYALRRHRDEPWTLPLFIKNKMINSFAAGLLSFLIDGNRTMLVAGTRSSGKTSLLGSLMLEIIPSVRTIVIEDTLELPVDSLRKLGYNILRMKVRSALVEGSSEVEASEGIRTSLRLGDSSLIIGEVRSNEAKALYEAMRVGALANVVAGTIHGDSPYGIFDRVVNDLNVPATSFKATDIIVIANPIETPDGLHSIKRVVSVTEVRKHWTKDPLEEGGLVDLLKYDVDKDELVPTEELINGDSEILKSIAGNVKGWAGDWNSVYENIILRGRIKQEIVEASEKTGKDNILESKFIVRSNYAFHRISEEVVRETGNSNSEIIFDRWKKWFHEEIGKF